jgi:hypothetical protein
MSARSYSSALTAGFILIILGVIFLLENVYTPFSAARLFGRYWPLIVILIGVKKLFDFFLWPEQPPSNDPSQAKE